ncbi:major facilitator superfamily domain-containing protein 9-like [Plodia interpunctella]|uniref:major facilitator superfamily domain-containing protein 9-like n=1 Tax=Plodia interpunctella TaxID=58824 RepID=UPI002368ED48|nr:major facilitator superfamily domain-containing protein 9-like [Plodia interpunctella]
MSFSICLLQAVAFLDLLAVGIIIPLVPGHARKMGANHIHVGLLGSIYAGFQLGSGPLIGSLSDLKGRKKILVMTLLISSIAYTCFGFVTSVALLLVIRAVLGIFKQTQMLTRALVADYERNEHKQSSIYGRMNAIAGAGITLGPVIGGHVLEDNPENGFLFVAIIVGMIFFLNAGLVYFLLEDKIKRPKKKPKRESNQYLVHSLYCSIKQSAVELYNVEWSIYWDVFLFKALVGFAMGIYYSNYQLYLKTVYELSPKYVGYVISFQGTIGSISSLFIAYINGFYKNDHDYSVRNFHIFALLSLSLMGLILANNVIIYLIWLVPLAVGNAVGRLVTLEMILKRCDGDHRGTLIGASNSVRSLAGVVAPMTAGLIGEYIGIVYVIYAALFSTLLGVVFSFLNRRSRQKED